MNWQFIFDRLREASTWRGFLMVLTACGVALSPDQSVAIVTAGLAVVGMLGAFLPDEFGKGEKPSSDTSPYRGPHGWLPK